MFGSISLSDHGNQLKSCHHWFPDQFVLGLLAAWFVLFIQAIPVPSPVPSVDGRKVAVPSAAKLSEPPADGQRSTTTLRYIGISSRADFRFIAFVSPSETETPRHFRVNDSTSFRNEYGQQIGRYASFLTEVPLGAEARLRGPRRGEGISQMLPDDWFMGDLWAALQKFREVYGVESTPKVRSIRVESGRTIACVEYGDPKGTPVFYFHGIPSGHREAMLVDTAARANGLRILAPDRPGVGASDPDRGRNLLDWPADVAQLADVLHIDRFAVIGVSGGGPYSIACAYAIPRRLTAVTVLSGVAPLDEPYAVGEVNVIERIPIRFCRRFPRVSGRLLDGVADEYRICGEPWSFDLTDVTPHVDVWYGTKDWSLSPYHATTVASRLPNATLHTLPNTGHLGSVANHADEVLTLLSSRIHDETSP